MGGELTKIVEMIRWENKAIGMFYKQKIDNSIPNVDVYASAEFPFNLVQYHFWMSIPNIRELVQVDVLNSMQPLSPARLM